MTKGVQEQRTRAFRMFKDEFTHLSELHWFFLYSTTHAADAAGRVRADRRKVSEALPVSAGDVPLALTPDTFVKRSEDWLAHLRVLLLLKGVASLESYLHRYTRYWLSWKGYDAAAPHELTKVGRAILKPAGVSNLNSLLCYLEVLLGISIPERGKVVCSPNVPSCAGKTKRRPWTRNCLRGDAMRPRASF